MSFCQIILTVSRLSSLRIASGPLRSAPQVVNIEWNPLKSISAQTLSLMKAHFGHGSYVR